MINCKRCLKTDATLPSQYIGQTGRTVRERFGEHRREIQNNTDESVTIHFNLPHHTLNDVELIVTPWNNILFLLPELKKWYKSDQGSLIIILPLCIVQLLHCVYVPIARVYPSALLVNHIRGTVFKLLYINISNAHCIFVAPMKNDFTHSKYGI